MKIIYGITKSNFGGAQRYVFDLARESKARGHEVAVLCGGNGPLVEELKNHGIRTLTSPHLQRDISIVDEFRAFHFIFRTLWEERPDVLHTNSSKMGGLGNLAGRLAGIRKIIFTGHAWEFNAPRPRWQKPIIKFFAWLTILFSHKTICVSERSREDMGGLPFIKDKLVVVHNGIDKFETLPRGEARLELELREDMPFVVGALAELHPVKGIDILIEAWSKFPKKEDSKLVILGDGEAREDLEELVQVLGVADSVLFKGYRENAKQYLSAFDLFILPSRSENFPYAILEAGIAGAPVIATNVGGVPEIITTGENGILIDKDEPDTLFSTIMLLSESKDLRKRLGEALRESTLKNFSIKKMVDETLRHY